MRSEIVMEPLLSRSYTTGYTVGKPSVTSSAFPSIVIPLVSSILVEFSTNPIQIFAGFTFPFSNVSATPPRVVPCVKRMLATSVCPSSVPSPQFHVAAARRCGDSQRIFAFPRRHRHTVEGRRIPVERQFSASVERREECRIVRNFRSESRDSVIICGEDPPPNFDPNRIPFVHPRFICRNLCRRRSFRSHIRNGGCFSNDDFCFCRGIQIDGERCFEEESVRRLRQIRERNTGGRQEFRSIHFRRQYVVRLRVMIGRRAPSQNIVCVRKSSICGHIRRHAVSSRTHRHSVTPTAGRFDDGLREFPRQNGRFLCCFQFLRH